MQEQDQYTEDNIRSLDWKEHIRMRPGMYIGKLGDGSSPDDGIYILLKEVLDNCIDEFVMGAGKTIEVTLKDKMVSVRDYGRGIPLGKVVDVVSKMNTGGKYDSKAFKKSVGLNGVGTKAVNALSNYFRVESVRDNQQKAAEFSAGNLTLEEDITESTKRKGTKVSFVADEAIFKNYKYRNEYIIKMLKNYCYLNTGLTIIYNGEKYYSDYGLKDLLEETISEEDIVYQIINLFGEYAYEQGKLNRSWISAQVFGNPEKVKALNAIVHPATIRDAHEWMSAQQTPYTLKEAALIFESGSEKSLDYVIGVDAPAELRIQRVMERDNITREAILQRMNNQMDESEKIQRCDFIIYNDGNQLVIPQVIRLHQQLVELSKSKSANG